VHGVVGRGGLHCVSAPTDKLVATAPSETRVSFGPCRSIRSALGIVTETKCRTDGSASARGGTGAITANGFPVLDSEGGFEGRQPKMLTIKPITNGTSRIGIEVVKRCISLAPRRGRPCKRGQTFLDPFLSNATEYGWTRAVRRWTGPANRQRKWIGGVVECRSEENGHAGLTKSRPFLAAEAIIRFTSSWVIGGGDAERSVVG